MKKILFVFSLIFLMGKIAFGQNWSPINTIEKFNFQNDTSDYISNTLWVDSIEVANNDSIFYLNRVVLFSFNFKIHL